MCVSSTIFISLVFKYKERRSENKKPKNLYT